MSTVAQDTTTTAAPKPVQYSADPELNALLSDLFNKQKQDDQDTRAVLQANQDRINKVFENKGVKDLPLQVHQELIPLLRQCPQIVPHVTIFTKSVIQAMAVAAGAQLAKTLQAVGGPPAT